MIINEPITFENTEYAFAYKSDRELKKAKFLFSSMGKPWLVKLGTTVTPWAIKWKLPIKNIIRNTIFSQFVGGETLEETALVASKLSQYNVQVILDYGVEGGHDGEIGFDQSTQNFIKVIEYAATQPNIPFMSIKITGLARFGLLEKIDKLMCEVQGTLITRYKQALAKLTTQEQQEWDRVVNRFTKICQAGASLKIGILVDAEETWIQNPIDAATLVLMDQFNKGTTVVFNTIQLYRHDRLAFLKDCHIAASERNFVLGAKLVRGAYMEKERKRAEELNYSSPIQANKAATDADFNEALDFCIKNIQQISTIVATHNEQSSMKTINQLSNNNLASNHPHIHFSQLYGMSDNITFNLAKAGCSVSKYLPFGPINDVIPYLMRRAQENTSIKGQTGRELKLINTELKKRKVSNKTTV